MPNRKSAVKRIKSTEKRTLRNKSARSAVRTLVTKCDALLKEGKKKEAGETYTQVTSALDKAVKRGVMHKNTASRQKSRLVLRLNAA